MTVTEAKNNFDKLIDLASHEPVTIMQGNQPITVITCKKPEEKKQTFINWFGKASLARENSHIGHSKNIEEMVQFIRDERNQWDK